MLPSTISHQARLQYQRIFALRLSIFLFLLLLLTVLPTGCSSSQKIPPTPTLPDPLPAYEELARTHNERVAELQQFHTYGVIEFRWSDQDGKHFEQGDLQLWMMLPHHSALRVSKLGDVLLWIGSDEQQYWLFDCLNDEKVLYLESHDYDFSSDEGDQPIMLPPHVIIDLMGLGELPIEVANKDNQDSPVGQASRLSLPLIEYDADNDAWLLTLAPDEHQLQQQISFSRQTGLLQRVVLLDQEQQPIVESSPRRYDRVEQERSLSVNWPLLPTLIDIKQPDGKYQVKLAFDSPSGIMHDQPLDRIFDLGRLIDALRPDFVEITEKP